VADKGKLNKGYMGTILRVDLTTGKVKTEPLPEELAKLYLGGRGLGAKVLYDEVKPGIDPLSSANKLIFANGPLTGTPAQSCSRWMVVTKSPLTGGIIRSTAGGSFGAELKSAGFDVLIVEGKAEKPVYLWINDDQVVMRDAGKLWGLLSDEAASAVRKELNDEKIKVATIGPAGEKLVRFAAIVDDRRTASRGGVGTVMGSKNLKAIAVRGSKRIEVADRAKLREVTKSQVAASQESPLFQGFSHLGTPGSTVLIHELGIYPVRNFQDGVLEGLHGNLTPEKIEEVFIKDVHCHNCYIHCGSIMRVARGPYAGKEVEGPEFETMWSFGGEVGNTNLGMIIEANRICDDYGVDTISAGSCIGFAMELFEKGILTKKDVDGLDLTWGNREAIIAILKKIVTREGIGDILAEGTKRAAEKIGRGANKYAMNVKGLEIPAYDPRGAKAHGLNLATSNIGASHMTGYATQELFGIPESVERFTPEGKGKLCKRNQDMTAIYDSIISCCFPVVFGWLGIAVYKQLLPAATGIEQFSDEKYLLDLGERIYTVERAFNVREGFSRKDDILPSRFLTETPKSGPVKGHIFEMDMMLDDYYEARGWDKKTGNPTRTALESLGLTCVADELEKIGKLPG
jgi:aldehyde:ferredoxin oxidoreductase